MIVKIFNLNKKFADKEYDKGNIYSFSSMESLKKHGLTVDIANYDCVFVGEMPEYDGMEYSEALERLYEQFNIGKRPETFRGHSMSVSDIVDLDGKKFYVDSFGFAELSSKPQAAIKHKMIEGQVFDLGLICMSSSVSMIANEDEKFITEIITCISRHARGDFLDMMEEDIQSNFNAIANGDERVFSSYPTSHRNLWIITEADRSATTILFPEDY